MNPAAKKHNQKETKALTDTPENDFAACLAVSLQKHPDLQQIIDLWPNLPEHTKQHILELVRNVRADNVKP